MFPQPVLAKEPIFQALKVPPQEDLPQHTTNQPRNLPAAPHPAQLTATQPLHPALPPAPPLASRAAPPRAQDQDATPTLTARRALPPPAHSLTAPHPGLNDMTLLRGLTTMTALPHPTEEDCIVLLARTQMTVADRVVLLARTARTQTTAVETHKS